MSLCNLPSFAFPVFGLPPLSLTIPLPIFPSIPSINLFCPLD
jgi:hypothetical protein